MKKIKLLDEKDQPDFEKKEVEKIEETETETLEEKREQHTQENSWMWYLIIFLIVAAIMYFNQQNNGK